MKLALVSIALLLAMPARAAEPAVAEIADPATFADALEGCTASTHAAPHPFMKGFVIQHVITGEKDDACAYSQTMPGDMRMECRLSEAGRRGLAGEFREQAQGRMSGGTGEQPAWTAECEIVGKDDRRTPMGA
jgi:hypothetical protein